MKKTPGFSPEEREQYWVEIITEARRFPDGIGAYLKSKGCEKNNYYYWFKRLSPMHPEWDDLTKAPGRRAKRTSVKKGSKLPKTEVTEKAQRRRFSSPEKARILDEFEQAGPGQGAAILRREGIYYSQIHQWRKDRKESSLKAKKRGPKPNPAAQEIKKLQAQLAKTEKKLKRANAIIDFQKKVAEILRSSMDESEDEE
jgi:transposase